MVKGVATFVPSWAPYGGPKPTIVVDQAALDNAGTGGVWNLLTSGKPAPRMTGPTTLGTVLTKTRFTWFGGNTSSAVATYDVRCRKARWDGSFGSWTRPASWQGTTVTNTPLGLRAGYDYCVSVRARNRAGQLSDWSGQRCLARALDDKRPQRLVGLDSARAPRPSTAAPRCPPRARAPRWSAPAPRSSGSAWWPPPAAPAARSRSSSTASGSARVNLSSPSRHRRQVFMLPAVKRGKAHVTLRVLTSGLTVQVDGLVLSRT